MSEIYNHENYAYVKHEVCPKCGSNGYKSIINNYSSTEYTNQPCTCMCCGDAHILGERVSKSLFNRNKILNKILNDKEV